mgnify:FL=1
MEYSAKENIAINKIKKKKIYEINQEENNKKCFDCQSSNPKYISLYNGIFICQNCVNDIHSKLGSNISLILDNDLNNLSIKDIQYLYYGGNKKLLDFINYEYPTLKSLSKNKLYLTKAMEYYRQWLKYLIDEGQKPLKPTFEESNELINDKKKKSNKKNKGNVITIDFLNNYYNYDDDNNTPGQELEDEKVYSYKTKQKKLSPDVYKKTYYTTNGINNLTISKYEMGEDWNNNTKTIKNGEQTKIERLMTDNQKNYFYINNSKKNIFPKKEYMNNITSNNYNDKNKNKLITKRLSLKTTKNYNKNKDKNFRIEKIENLSNSINGKPIIKISEKSQKIYSKPTLLNSFQRNAPSRNRTINQIEDLSYMKTSYLIPTGNNYQSILINNNTFDKFLMNNSNNQTNEHKDNINISESQMLSPRAILNSYKCLNISTNIYNTNTNTNLNNNDYAVFKKKTLKNSFSITMRKKKDQKSSNSNINNNKKSNESMIERTNFQIISGKDNKDNSQKENKNIINIRNKNFNLDFSVEKKKDNNKEENNNENIINEIKVKKANKYFNEENESVEQIKHNLSKINNQENNFEINKNKIPKYKYNDNKYNKDIIKDTESYKNIRDSNKKKLLIINQLINNKRKSLNPNLNYNNANRDNSRLSTRELGGKKEEYINSYLSYGYGNKMDRQKPNFVGKKAKEIFLLENSGKRVKMYKNDNNSGNFNKSYDDNLNGKHKFRLRHNEVVTIDKIKKSKNINLNDDKLKEFKGDIKTQREREKY